MPLKPAPVVAAIDALIATLNDAQPRGPVLTFDVSSVASLESPTERAALADRLVGVGAHHVIRAAIVGDDAAFVGLGEAASCASAEAIGDLVAAAPGRRAVVTLPFPSSSSSSWRRLVERVAWAPQIFWQHRDGVSTFGVDLGWDRGSEHESEKDRRQEARALLVGWREALCDPRSSSSSSSSSRLEVAGSSLVPDEVAHRAAVDAALASIAAGHLEKVVLARRRQLRLRGGSTTDLPLALWRAAPRSAADEVAFLIDVVGDAFVGVTPERLCRRRGRHLLVDVLAGTASPETTGLLDDDKERREHESVRRFVHEALRPVTTHVESPEAPVVVRLRQLQHLYTPVRAELVDDAPVFARLHPTPAVAGVPQAQALASIAELEGFSRGLYAGVVGVIDASGEDLRVALRCAQVRADDDGADVFFYVGSGIVRGSDPASEWRELDRKEQTMATALGALVAPVSMRSAHVLA